MRPLVRRAYVSRCGATYAAVGCVCTKRGCRALCFSCDLRFLDHTGSLGPLNGRVYRPKCDYKFCPSCVVTEICPSLEGAGWLAGGKLCRKQFGDQRVAQNRPCRTLPPHRPQPPRLRPLELKQIHFKRTHTDGHSLSIESFNSTESIKSSEW